MGTLELKTNLHCQGCVDKISPLLNDDKHIKQWSVDLSPNTKTLHVEGDTISAQHIDELLNQVGYGVLVDQKTTSFWSDMKAWNRASFNTLNCLIGCSIGDFGMIFYLQAFYPGTSMIPQMILAIIAGLCTSIMLESIILKYREHFNWAFAVKTAFGMSFISMIAMELAMTATDFMMTGGKAAFTDPVYWMALIPALIVGFLTPLPYNYYKLKKFNKTCH